MLASEILASRNRELDDSDKSLVDLPATCVY
jgi:hypothetical protein